MTSTQQLIEARVNALIGLPLSIARRAADMRIFHFGKIRSVEDGTIGDYALHIQCPWRIEHNNTIITGRSDLWEPALDNPEQYHDDWDYDKDGNLQDSCINSIFESQDPSTRSYVSTSTPLTVEKVQVDMMGGLTISLSHHYRIVLFPAGSRGEDWRFFSPDQDNTIPDLIISGGRIEQDGDEEE